MAQVSVAAIEPDSDVIYIRDKIGTLRVTTLLNLGDSPIATLTISPDLVPSLATTTLTNAKGHPAITQIWTVMPLSHIATPPPSTETGSNEVPIATISRPPVPPETYTMVYYIGPGQYFIGMFLPTIITNLIAMFVRIISTNANYFQPWHSLTHRMPGGWRSIFRSVRSVSSREANTAKNCAWVLSASPHVSGASIVILALMAFTLVLLLGTLRKCICTLASLSLSKEVQQLVVGTETPLRNQRRDLLTQNFELRQFQLTTRKTEYGIVTLDEPNEVQVVPPANKPKTGASSKRQPSTKPFTLGYLRKLFLLFMARGVLVLVLYYSQTLSDTAFKRFINSNSFGVRFLITSLGIVICFLWSSLLILLASRLQSAFWPLISIWISVGILSFTIIVIVTSFFIKWPYITAHPRSIAGAIYYISDSPMLERFDGLSILKRKERDQRVMKLDLLVRMGINTSDRKGCMPL
ncbi:hypothetical protein F5B21DRAFT_512072 [Xylaria acuta]|nr:hypothetical protein F5B21DRAFT_512072 [Xylaria acuta]